MAITAAQVKELRERTGSGMMECKKALVETDGDIDAAAQLLRTKGQAKAEKRAGKTAAEGVITILADDAQTTAVIVEINSETDFVAKGDDFVSFGKQVAQCVMDNTPENIEALMSFSIGNATVEDTRKTLIAKLGENINVRRFVKVSSENGVLATYLHGAKIGVLVDITGGDEHVGKDIAMQVAAVRPVCITEQEVPAELIAKEKSVFEAQAKESGKPDNIIEKMVVGRMKKYFKEVTLLGQTFVKDQDLSVEKYLQNAHATVNAFYRYEVGEGIEKKVENFAEEVRAQVRGNE